MKVRETLGVASLIAGVVLNLVWVGFLVRVVGKGIASVVDQ